ncbi:cytochrome c3 family protein [Ideonella sp. A 288]|uniref:cytochrome c3 family protein n=1 Tax=Ideonella sp. A 288 TaxID=1962181 RepID=UPI001F2A8EFF|nr:cytochrome c3 family protein [Ideonella sp. A 288]
MTQIKPWSQAAVRGALVALMFGSVMTVSADVDLPTKFDNARSISNTRHNLTQRQAAGGPVSTTMDRFRNDYGEVCVYCHTPHGSNANVVLPLWNRTIKATTYNTYDQLGTSTITQQVSQPGPNSLSCLSCHDGQVAVDSVINMPGAGGYLAAQATVQNNTFLNAWTNPSGIDATVHVGLDPVVANGCLSCHSAGAGINGTGATDFAAFVIGTDLRNDHPVGVRFPTPGPGVDFNTPGATRPGLRWFDNNGNNFPDPREVRLYDSGEGFEVECASCHDPHGVPSAGVGSSFNPSFLRVSNAGSAVCLTCHTK